MSHASARSNLIFCFLLTLIFTFFFFPGGDTQLASFYFFFFFPGGGTAGQDLSSQTRD